jgi:hypothetical protein
MNKTKNAANNCVIFITSSRIIKAKIIEIAGPELLMIADLLEPILLIASETNNKGKKVQKKAKHNIIIKAS